MAINPLPFLQAMPDPGQAFMQSFQAARQQRLAQEQAMQQQVAQQQRQQRYAQFIQRLKTDRSPEAMSEFMLEFPEQAEAIKKAYEPINDAIKQTRLNYSTQVYSALERGDASSAQRIAGELLTAAKNTPGQEQYAKELQFGLELMQRSPEEAKVALANTIFTLDPERYKTMYGEGGLTSFQKDLRAANINPQSEEGVEKSRQFLELKIDPIVEMPTPQGGKFVGQRSKYYEMFGKGAPTPRIKQPPRIGEIRNGFAFTGGDPGVQSNWVKAKPLQDTKAPELGAGGIPSVLTRAQYDAIVEVKGKGETDAWMLRNGVRLGEQ